MSEDSTPLSDAAVAIHELFTAFVSAGFTRASALQLVIVQLPKFQADSGGNAS